MADPLYFAGKDKPKGLAEVGNIDLLTRPKVPNPEGGVSTVLSMSFNDDGKEVLVPMVSDDGRILTEDQARQMYFDTGKHLGKFDTADAADAYAEALHQQQATLFNPQDAVMQELSSDPRVIQFLMSMGGLR